MAAGTTIEKLFLSLGLDMTALDADLLTADKEVQKGMTNLNRKTQQVKLKMDIDLSRFPDAEKSVEALTIKEKALSAQHDIQRQKVELVNFAYQKSIDAKGADDVSSQRLLTRLLKEQKAEADLAAQIQKTNAIRAKIVAPPTPPVVNQTGAIDKISDASKNAGNSISLLHSKFIELMAVATTGAGLFSFVKSAIETGNAVYMLSSKMHMSVGEAIELNKTLKMSDIDTQAFITTMIRLDKSVMEAGLDGNMITNSLKEFGISMTDKTGKLLPYNEQLKQLAKGYQEAEKTGQEAEFVSQTLGPKGSSLVPLLQQYNDFMEAASRIKTTSLLDPKMAHEMSIEMKVLNAEADQLKGAFGAALLPVAQEVAPQVIEGLSSVVEKVKENKTEIIDTAKGVVEISKDVGSAIKGVASEISPVITGIEKLNKATGGATGEIAKTGIEIWLANKGLTAMAAALSLPLAGWAKIAIATKLATDSLIGYMKAQKEAEDTKRTIEMGGNAPDINNAKMRINPDNGRGQKEIVEDQNMSQFWKDYWKSKVGFVPQVKRYVDLSDEEEKNRLDRLNKESIKAARRAQLESITEADTGKPLTKERIDETLKDEFDDEYSTKKWKDSQMAQLEQKKMIDAEKLKSAKELSDKMYRLNHSDLENTLHDIETERQEFIKKTGDEVAATQWAEAAKAKARKDATRDIDLKIYKNSHSDLEGSLRDIEEERLNNIKKNGDEAKANQLAEIEKAKVIKDANKQLNDELYKISHSTLENRLHDIETERQAWIKKVGDEVRATQLAEKEKLKAVKDAIYAKYGEEIRAVKEAREQGKDPNEAYRAAREKRLRSEEADDYALRYVEDAEGIVMPGQVQKKIITDGRNINSHDEISTTGYYDPAQLKVHVAGEPDQPQQKIVIDGRTIRNAQISELQPMIQELKDNATANNKAQEFTQALANANNHSSNTSQSSGGIIINQQTPISFSGFTSESINNAVEKAKEAFGKELYTAIQDAKTQYNI